MRFKPRCHFRPSAFEIIKFRKLVTNTNATRNPQS